jgi:hypothetical protein
MKKLFSLLLVLMASGQIFAASELNAVTFNMADGAQTSYLFADRPTVVMEGDNVTIKAGEKVVTCLFSEILKVTFGAVDTSIKSVANNRRTVLLDGKTIGFSGIQPNEQVAVYSLSGSRLRTSRADADGNLQLDLGSLAPQVVIVKSKSSTFKTLVR